ncbi:MAG: sulfotransferase [Sphingobium sp.]
MSALFNPARLMAVAQERTGLSDFGDLSFRRPLAMLCASLHEEAPLTEKGREAHAERLIACLCERLALNDWVRRFPEITEEPLAPPVVIAGLPRTGTTMLYRMLAAADGLASPLFYEAVQVSPAPDWEFTVANDARIPAAEQRVAAMMEAMPDLASIYPFEAMAPEESIFLYGPSILTTSQQSSALVPSYDGWFASADKRPAYRYLKLTVQFLQWQRRRSGRWTEGERWLLKTPDHLHGLEELLDVFPGARIIQTHRDPVKTIPSICSFIHVLHQPTTARDDAKDIGAAWSRMFADSMTRAIAVRDRNPGSFLDIWYRDTVASPRQVAEEVFAFIGQPLTEQGWEEMQRWRDANKREARPSHHYTLEEFGLDVEGIETLFRDYRDRFIVPAGVAHSQAAAA